MRRFSKFGATQLSTISSSPHTGSMKSPRFMPSYAYANSSIKVDSIDISSERTKLKLESPGGSTNSLSDASNKFENALKDMPSGSIEELGEVIDNQLMSRMNGIKHQKNNTRRKTYKEEEDNDVNLSEAQQKNIKLVKKIDRFRNFKGMMSNSKEHKFEQRLKEFSNVKTFIKITQVIKNISGSVQNSQPKKPTPSKYRFSNRKLTRSPSDESFKRSVADIQSPHNGEDPTMKKKDLGIKGYDLEEIELDEVYQQLKENIIRQIGQEAFEMIEAELLNPTKQKEMKTKTKEQIQKLREMRNQMKNSNIFHSLIDHLARTAKPRVKDNHEEEVEARNTPFYHKLDEQIKQQNIEILTMLNTISTDDKSDREINGPKLHLRTLLLKHELERNEELTKGYIPPSFDRSLDNKEEADGQLRAAGVLGKYKERSKKVIEILKKKTMRLKSEASKVNKATIEADRNNLNKIYNRLNTINASATSSSSSKRSKMLIKDEKEDEVKGAATLPYLAKASIFRSQSKLDLQTKLDLQSTSPANKRSPGENMTFGSQSARLHHNIMENKEKFKNIKKQSSLKFGSSPKNTSGYGSSEFGLSPRSYQNTYYNKLGQSDYFTLTSRSGSHSVKNSFGLACENSLEGIKGMLNEMSLTNRQFESELSESQRRMQEYTIPKWTQCKQLKFQIL